MSKCTEIREICGDWAFDIVYNDGETFMLLFNSRRNAETVKRCLEVDDSIPNTATPVDFVEVVRCKDCAYLSKNNNECRTCRDIDEPCGICHCLGFCTNDDGYCHRGERRKDDAEIY